MYLEEQKISNISDSQWNKIELIERNGPIKLNKINFICKNDVGKELELIYIIPMAFTSILFIIFICICFSRKSKSSESKDNSNSQQNQSLERDMNEPSNSVNIHLYLLKRSKTTNRFLLKFHL